MPGWDVSFSLQQFVGGREADATIPTFKRCEQAALDIFKTHWKCAQTHLPTTHLPPRTTHRSLHPFRSFPLIPRRVQAD